MNLVVDLGNTRIKVAVFDKAGDILFSYATKKRYSENVLSKIPKAYNIESAILSNTSSVGEKLLEKLSSYAYFIHLDENTPIPIVNKYGTPNTLGKDRIAAAVRANMLFPYQNTLFIDMGTCITINLINDKREFVGGNISPGILMRLKAMHKFTAKLPLVQPILNNEDFGTTTVKALQNGGVRGTFIEIESFIRDTRSKIGEINVILTGGDAYFFESWTKNEIFVAPNLVMEGLNEILNYNAK